MSETAGGEGSRRHARPSELFHPLAVAIAAIFVVGLAALTAYSPKDAIVALLVLTVAVVLAYLPKSAVNYLLGFVVLLFVIPSTLTVEGPLNAIGQPSTIFGWGAGVLWVAARLHIDSGLDRRRNPARWTILFFATVVVLAFGVAYTRPLTHLEIQGTYRSISKLSAYIGIGLLTTDSLKTRQDIDRLLKGIIVGALFSAVVGIIQFRTGFDYIDRVHFPGLRISNGTNGGRSSTRQGLNRVTGTAHHPIEYAVTLVTTLPLALHYSVHLPSGRFRTFMRLATAVIAVAVPTAISRTGTVGIVIVILFVAADWSWRRRANMAGLAVLVATAVAVAVPRLLGTVRGLIDSLLGRNSASINGRTSDYDHVKPYLHGHLLLGRGQGTFQVGQYFTLDNQYLNELLAAGIIGVVAVLGIYLSIMTLSRGARKRGRDQVDRSLGQALTAGGAALAFSAATFDLFGFTQAVGLTFLLLGVSGAFWRLTWYETKARKAAELTDTELRGQPVLVK
jgi:hypothetical protein